MRIGRRRRRPTPEPIDITQWRQKLDAAIEAAAAPTAHVPVAHFNDEWQPVYCGCSCGWRSHRPTRDFRRAHRDHVRIARRAA